jgi:hypothetical protein
LVAAWPPAGRALQGSSVSVMADESLTFFCDEARHLVCLPYSRENLHRMAQMLGIKRCWFHSSTKYPHYDIPKRRVAEIAAKCLIVEARTILAICRGLSAP